MLNDCHLYNMSQIGLKNLGSYVRLLLNIWIYTVITEKQ